MAGPGGESGPGSGGDLGGVWEFFPGLDLDSLAELVYTDLVAEALAGAEDSEEAEENKYDLDSQLGLVGRVIDDDVKAFMAGYGDVYSGGQKVEARGKPSRGPAGPAVYEGED